MKVLIAALYMMIVPVQISEVWLAMQKYKFIEEHHLERVQLSCYLPTGYRTADGTVPYEGVVSSNTEHLGMDCIVYDEDLVAVMRLECRDVGGHPMLQNGTAIDIYRSNMDRCWQLVGEYGTHVWVQWIPREEVTSDSTD